MTNFNPIEKAIGDFNDPDQPLNSYPKGRPISDGLLIDKCDLLQHFRARATVVGDLRRCSRSLTFLLETTEEMLRRPGGVRSPGIDGIADDSWTAAVIAYGRCFVSPDGRKPLIADEVERMGGDKAAHAALMAERHENQAHTTARDRIIEVFAMFAEDASIRNLAIIEPSLPLPGATALRSYRAHVMALAKAVTAELDKMAPRIVARLNAEYGVDMKRCFDAGEVWSQTT